MLIRYFFCLLLILFSSIALAQAPAVDTDVAKTEAEKKAEAERRIKEQEELEKKLKDKASREKASKTEDDGGVFKPTEEISEDSPAPFPVDI